MYQGRRSHSVAITATSAVWTPLLNIPEGDGWIELFSQDCFVSWQIKSVVDGVTRTEYQQTGPAGSRALVRLAAGGNATIEYQIPHVMAATMHVSPESGLYDPQGTRAASVAAVYFETEPDTDRQVQAGAWTTDGGDSVLAAGGVTSYYFPPGYCRYWQWLDYGDQPVNIYMLDGQINGAGGKGGDYIHLRSGTSSDRGRMHPWHAIEVENAGAGTLSGGVLTFDTDGDA